MVVGRGRVGSSTALVLLGQLDGTLHLFLLGGGSSARDLIVLQAREGGQMSGSGSGTRRKERTGGGSCRVDSVRAEE